jgi:hypothetical protein
VYAGMVVVAGLIVFFKPTWWSWTILIITAATLVGDVINLRRRAGARRPAEDRPEAGSTKRT